MPGQIIAFGSAHNVVWIWDSTERCVLHRLTGHTDYIDDLSFSPDGSMLASCSNDNSIKIWGVSKGNLIATLSIKYSCVSMEFSTDGKFLISAELDGIRYWDTTNWSEVHHSPFSSRIKGRPYSLAVALNGEYISYGTDKDKITVLSSPSFSSIPLAYEPETMRTLAVFEGHESTICGLDISSDSRLIASCSVDESIRIWDIDSQKEVTKFSGHNGWVASVSFSPDGKIVASGGSDGKLKLWNLNTKKCHDTCTGHTLAVNSISYSPDGRSIASASDDGSVRLWQVANLSDSEVLFNLVDNIPITVIQYSPLT